MKDVLGLRKLVPYLLFICGCVAMILFLPDYPKDQVQQNQFTSVADSRDRAKSPRSSGSTKSLPQPAAASAN